MKALKAPSNKIEIIQALNLVYADLAQTLYKLDDEQMYLNVDGKWSIAGHTQHLILSSKPIAGALKLSKFKLLPFGINFSKPKSYEQLYEVYLQKLATGVKAPSNYAPGQEEVIAQAELLNNWNSIGEKISNRLSHWNEAQLSRFQLPHPVIGKISIREMLYFTIFHTRHHHKAIEHILLSHSALE